MQPKQTDLKDFVLCSNESLCKIYSYNIYHMIMQIFIYFSPYGKTKQRLIFKHTKT